MWVFWCIPALIPYVIDRLVIRIFYRGNKRMALARVYFWGDPAKPDRPPNVITLQFDNKVNDKGVKPLLYMEGHYLYLQCPAVDNTRGPLREWHPFTISSAPDEQVLEVNIRVMPHKDSWTRKVADYLQLLDPPDPVTKKRKGMVELFTRNPQTGELTLGKVLGPDGRQFFRVDAPHGAPSQHVYRYRTCMLVGAGIGVTPCASIMKGVIGYRWKKGFSPSHLHFFWVARRSDLSTFKWLLALLPQLKLEEKKHNEHYGGDEQQLQAMESRVKVLRNELGVGGPSSVGASGLPPGWQSAKTEDGHTYYWNSQTQERTWAVPTAGPPGALPGQDMRAKQDELLQTQESLVAASIGNRSLTITLYLTGCKDADIQPDPSAAPDSEAGLITKLLESKVIIKAGRPRWDSEFTQIAETYNTMYGKEEVGVVFCGAPLIAAALKEQCEEKSDVNGTLFRLHKENF